MSLVSVTSPWEAKCSRRRSSVKCLGKFLTISRDLELNRSLAIGSIVAQYIASSWCLLTFTAIPKSDSKAAVATWRDFFFSRSRDNLAVTMVHVIVVFSNNFCCKLSIEKAQQTCGNNTMSAQKLASVTKNGVGAYVLQCRKMVFNYCENWGSNKGMM